VRSKFAAAESRQLLAGAAAEPGAASCACAASVYRIPGSSGDAIPARVHAFKNARRLKVMRDNSFRSKET
jgi:hypothetical protein